MRRLSVAALLLLGACARAADPAPPAASSAKAPPRPVFLCLGDSLTAGYGIAAEQAWPALLQRKFDEAGILAEVRNAGVSGSTSKGVLENVDWHLAPEVRWVLLATGANDGLRGLDLDVTEANISGILDAARAKKISIVLAGMMIPPNYGPEYTARFAAMYPELARKFRAPLIPFLLEGVGGVAAMNQKDGIHPNEEGHRRVADTVFKFLLDNGVVKAGA